MSFIKYIIIYIFIQVIKPYWKETLIIVAVITIVMLIRLIRRQKKAIEEYQNLPDAIESTEYRNAMYNTLQLIGCQPTINFDGSITVAYQGKKFLIIFAGKDVGVLYPSWARIRSDDPNLPAIRQIIDKADFGVGTQLIMSDPDNNGIISIHTNRDITYDPTNAENETLITAVLNSFFDIETQICEKVKQLGIHVERKK